MTGVSTGDGTGDGAGGGVGPEPPESHPATARANARKLSVRSIGAGVGGARFYSSGRVGSGMLECAAAQTRNASTVAGRQSTATARIVSPRAGSA